MARAICVVEYFPYHSRGFRDTVRVPSQEYSVHLMREAMKRNACIVALRKVRDLLQVVPELREYPIITARSMQNATVSPGNIDRFNELCDAIRSV